MNVDFSLILVILAIVAGSIVLLDRFVLAPKRVKATGDAGDANDAAKTDDGTLPFWIEWSRSLLPVIILVLIIRSFIFEPFRIPSGSLEPTLLIGDLIVVNKYDYGLRLPVLNNKILKVGEPSRGDVVVFRWPVNPHIDYIKRVIGKPGDRITYKNKVLTINGVEAKQKFVAYTTSVNEYGQRKKVEKRIENLSGHQHAIFIDPDAPARDLEYKVPAGHYFVMGDNRDDSSDSRYWGYLPESNLLGRAFAIWMSWDGQKSSVRFNRVGKRIV